MSTEFKTKTGVTMATRFWGGVVRGTVVQMEMTKSMFEAVANRQVFENGVNPMGNFGDWVRRQENVEQCEVVWATSFGTES